MRRGEDDEPRRRGRASLTCWVNRERELSWKQDGSWVATCQPMSFGQLFRLYSDGDRREGSPRIHGAASEFVGLVILDCARMQESGLAAVERMARAQLAARRRGRQVALLNASSELLELIHLAGLDRSLGVEVNRQPEQRE